MLSDHLETIQRVCFALEPSDADLTALGDHQRWSMYRNMVRARLFRVIRAALPRTTKALGAESFEETISRWLAEYGPHTPYYRDVALEFADWWLADSHSDTPAWLKELANYERVRWQVKHMPAEEPAFGDFHFERPAALNPTFQILALSYPVHEEPTPDHGYEPSATTVGVCRNAEHGVSTWTLNATAAELLSAWSDPKQTVTEGVQKVAADRDLTVDAHFIGKLSGMIADFIERGIILGSLT